MTAAAFRQRTRAFWSSDAGCALLVALLALLLRLLYLGLFVGPDYAPELDAREYSDIAANLAAGRGYRLADGTATAIRPPLFPLLLAGVYRLFGAGPAGYAAGLVLEALLGAGIAVGTAVVGRQVFGRAAGRLAGLIAAGYPLLIFAGASLLTEPLFTLLVVWAAALGLRIQARPSAGGALALGVLLGLAGLARPNGLLLIPCLLLWLLLAEKGPWRPRFGRIALALLAAAAVTAPWVVRNYAIFGRFIPTTTMGGAVLLGSYNARVLNEPALHGDWVSPCEVPGAGWSCALDELARDDAWRDLGLAFIRDHLADLPALAWWRFVKFWHLYPFSHGFPEVIGFWAYAAVAVLALAGALRALAARAWRRAAAPAAVILCFMASALVFWGGFRMRTPAEPALIVLAAGALAALWRRLRSAA